MRSPTPLHSLRYFALAALLGAGLTILASCGPSAEQQQLEEANAALQEEVAGLRADLALALGDLTNAREDMEAAQAQVAELETARNELVEELAVVQAQVDSRGESADSTERADGSAPLDVEPAPGSSAVEAETVAEVETLLTVAEVELASAKANLQLVQENLAAVEVERALLAEQLEEAIASRDALAEELASVQAEQIEAAAALENAEAARDANADALEEARALAARLTVDLERAIEDQRGLAEVSEAQRDELARIRMELEATQNEVVRLSGARGIYTVQYADSLSSIATFFYRNGNRWPEILQANDNLIDDPDLIFPGMVLIVPGES